ncbi:hypothetical protein [Agaribacterium sp. ZY112]|uniref:hypothetical protein n=1 Tax=Agaribacterium sp. ZY112 TaxID=3233574 RepID=UPI0035259D64
MSKYAVLFLVFFASFSVAETISKAGKVNKIRSVSSSHPSVDQYVSVFTLIPTQTSCKWIKLAPNSDAYLSTLLFAKAQNLDVLVWYDDESCQTITIEVK